MSAIAAHIDVEPLPPMATVIGALDRAGRRSAAEARDHTVAAVRRVLPAHRGHLKADTRGRVTRTGDGYSIEVKPSGKHRYKSGVTTRQVARFVEGGTGVFGPTGRPIRPRKAGAFQLPSGWRSGTVQGQRAQHPFARAQRSEDAAVTRILEDGARDAARDMERVLNG